MREQVATGCDWLPTLAEYCRVPLTEPQAADLDGRSLRRIIDSPTEPTPHPAFHWATGANEWAVHEGDWKLLGNPIDPTEKTPGHKPDALFLVNLKQDIGERTNVAAANPQIVDHLRRLHQAWARSVPQSGPGPKPLPSD